MIIKAKVKTGQKKFSVVRGEEWTVFVKNEAKGNKANMEIIKELSKFYKKVRVLSGAKAKRKILDIEQ